MRGVGKTHLAAAYTRTRIHDGWPVIAWINGEDPDQLITGLADLAHQLGISSPGDDTTTAAKTARAWLQTTTEPALLIIDNAEDPDALRPWIPTTGTTHVVITTTNHAFTTTATGIPVDVFTQAQALAYLDQQTGLADPDGARQVADALGCLPLALAQAAWLITAQGKTYPAYLAQLRSQPLAKTLRATANYPRSVPEAFLLTIDQAQAADPTGTTRQTLDTLALLSPTGVPRTLLNALIDAPDEQINDALGTLAQASLITYTLDRTAVIMHRLVQHALRDRATHHNTLTTTTDHIAKILSEHTIPHDQAWSHRTEATQLIDQITALTDHSSTTPDAETATPLLELRLWALAHLTEVVDLTRAITLGTQLADAVGPILGEEHWITDHTIDRLARAHQAAGLPTQAIPLLERVLDTSERQFGPDHRNTLTSRNNLAGAYSEAGRHGEAITLHEQNLADRERILGTDHPDTLNSRNNLATTYRDVGRHGDAITLHERNLADCQRILGTDHPDTLKSGNNLATAYRDAGRTADAITLFEQTLTTRERLLGTDHPDTLSSRNNLAAAYREAGRHGEAITLHEQTLADRQRILGPDHPHTLLTRGSLANAYRDAGRHGEAITLHEQTLTDRLRILGPDHPSTLTSRNNLANAYSNAGRTTEAITLYEQNLADSERILGPDHPSTLTNRNNLATARQNARQGPSRARVRKIRWRIRRKR